MRRTAFDPERNKQSTEYNERVLQRSSLTHASAQSTNSFSPAACVCRMVGENHSQPIPIEIDRIPGEAYQRAYVTTRMTERTVHWLSLGAVHTLEGPRRLEAMASELRSGLGAEDMMAPFIALF